MLEELQPFIELGGTGVAILSVFALIIVLVRNWIFPSSKKDDDSVVLLTKQIETLTNYYNHDLTSKLDRIENNLINIRGDMGKLSERLVACETELKLNRE